MGPSLNGIHQFFFDESMQAEEATDSGFNSRRPMELVICVEHFRFPRQKSVRNHSLNVIPNCLI